MTIQNKIYFNETYLRTHVNKDKLITRIKSAIESGIFLNGKENVLLEKTLSNQLGIQYVHTVASGHDALLLCLFALKLSITDEVIVPANAYPTAFPASLSGAKLILCDVDNDGQMSLESLKKEVSQNTKVIILVHMYGQVGDIERIIEYAKEKNIILVEDCAQAYGTTFNNKHVGTLGDIGCFSFYPTKNLGALGDGGAIVTNNKDYSDNIQMLKSYGEKSRYASLIIAGHSRLPEIQAGALNIYLEDQESSSKKRKRLFLYYFHQIKKTGTPVRPFLSHPDSDPVPHLFVIEVKKKRIASY